MKSSPTCAFISNDFKMHGGGLTIAVCMICNVMSVEVQWIERKLSFNELSSFIDITPYYRFGYMAANGALLERFEGVERLHILDFSTTHCMQWPTFIDALADRLDGPPHVRLTVSSATPPRPPGLHSSYEELGSRLTAFAYSKSVPFEFHILTQPLETLCVSDIGLRDGEALGVNCAFRLHYLADESAAGPEFAVNSCCPRDRFLQLIHSLNPVIVTLYEEDCDTTSLDLSWRLKLSFNYEWMPFDILATYPEYVSTHHRLEQEREVGQKIENIVACEGLCRIERLESKQQWHQRLHRLHFRPLPVGEDVVTELKKMVADHAAGWGMKWEKSVDDTAVMLSWKGNSLAFASTWAPSSCSFWLRLDPWRMRGSIELAVMKNFLCLFRFLSFRKVWNWGQLSNGYTTLFGDARNQFQNGSWEDGDWQDFETGHFCELG